MIFRVNRPAITKKKIPKTVASKQNNRGKTVCRKKTQRREQCLCWSDDKLYWCCSALLSRSAVRRGEEEEEERVVSSFSVCTFFFFLLHPVDPVTGARASVCVWAARRPRPTVLSVFLSQLERTWAAGVTSRPAEQTSEAREGAGPRL